MIAIKKDFENIPDYLDSPWAIDANKHNINALRYEKGDYGNKDITDKLDSIYHSKCAYCESKVNVSGFDRIEHYRPKSIYYWMALSWSNLLISCEICNNAKDVLFETKNERAKYKKETLKELHNKTTEYDALEQPLLINPEQETTESLASHFNFNIEKCEIEAKTERMKYTISTCDLNRDLLVKVRYSIKNDITKAIEGFINKSFPNIYEIFEVLQKAEFEKAIPEREYSAWRKYLCQNFDLLVVECFKTLG